ncbi:hypothetical protein CVT26_007615 [Gymnopilus dilepis]|uniref:RRM domain-containing protein n=1 Tax=Gymnopilus dilepis TaxID=231916 RepID=A0A409VZY3_9AGAR|nr:hypothetical protein CVT26_007615 [Gymnopilus dilepis]
MRIVCPGSSSQILPEVPVSANKRGNPVHSNKSGRRSRVAERDRKTKITQVSEAKKLWDKKRGLTYVYVGNLECTITQKRLKEFFQDCGKVTRITIRCSRGQGCVAVAIPEQARTERDRLYATVEFSDSKATRNALAYNGKVLDGCKVIVSASVLDLPECEQVINSK